jgi:hypothetical protein
LLMGGTLTIQLLVVGRVLVLLPSGEAWNADRIRY